MKPSRRNDAFTLIEVMIATAILLMMTIMMGSLFRQASSAWDAGNAKAEGGMVVRGVVGAITRDMATAVDGRAYGMSSSFVCDGSKLQFWCLKPTARNGVTNREPHLVTYTGGSGVTRTDKTLGGGTDTSDIFDDNDLKGFGAKFTFEAIDPPPLSQTNPSSSDSVRSGSGYEGLDGSGDYAWNGPASVKVTLKLTQDGSFSGLGVRSWGPNGIEGSKPGRENDDIEVK